MESTLDTVLVALSPEITDENADRLLDAAMQVAGPADATVVLTYVVSGEEFLDAAERLGHEGASRDDADEVLADHETVTHLGARLDERGIDYVVHGAVGQVAEEVIAAAEAEGADQVFVSGRPRSPTGKAVFGSTAQDIILDSPCPVTYVAAQSD
ncbi:universal stress protein [Halarchaeum salinum]|uniref:Universal stress protein n=1 Tax=Halarchaeum salinum TaxID=489912 RepID=A0AAV3S5S1_9EURY